MLELRIKQGRRHVPIFDLPAHLGRQAAAVELGDTIDGLMAFLDDLSGDPDLEDGGDDEHDGTEQADPAWIEWHQTHPGIRDRCQTAGLEDSEEDENERDESESSALQFSDLAARAEHRRRIQRTRCWPKYRYLRDWRTGEVTGRELLRYQLYDDAIPSRRQLLKRKRGMPRRPRA